MSEPLLSEVERAELDALLDGLEKYAGPRWASAPTLIRRALAENARLAAELAALAPLADLRCELIEGHAAAAEMGAARERDFSRQLIQISLDSTDEAEATAPAEALVKATLKAVLKMLLAGVNARGPCLPAPPAEGELERLRAIERALRKMVHITRRGNLELEGGRAEWEALQDALSLTVPQSAFPEDHPALTGIPV